MNLLRALRWIAPILVPTAVLAQNAQVRTLGQDWVGTDGNQRTAKIGLWFEGQVYTDPALVRRLEINWQDFPYQQGAFPMPVGDEDVRAELRVLLDVEASGVPKACRVDRPSDVAAIDVAACSHLMKYLRFYPALTPDGGRVGGQLKTRVTYSAGRIRMYTQGGTVPMLWQPKPRPLQPIDKAALGFGPKDGLPDSVGGTSGWLRVETDGSVSACTLAAPTQVDSFDLAMCARLRALRFEPAVDRAGKIVAADYGFGVSRR